MNYKMIGRVLGQLLTIEALFLAVPLAICLAAADAGGALAFALTLVLCAGLGIGLWCVCNRAGKLFGPREGMVCVSLGWILMSALGCLPFVISGQIPRYIDAFFEVVSGFTTTGASVLSAPEKLTAGMLYWRSFTHWVGGMGVLVFLLAIAPGQGGFTMHLLRAESPGPDVGKLVPRMKKTAGILYIIYIVMTVLDVIFLLLDGSLSFLQALCTAFGTAGTGGLGVFGDSMMSCTPWVQGVTTVFMFLFGVNFSCYYLLILGSWKSVLKDEELRAYVGIALAAVVVLVLNIRHLYGSLAQTLHHAAFQVSSIMTTTGYTTADFDRWPLLSKGILVFLMLMGACAGSTGGGFKVGRALLVMKSLRRNVRKVANPKRVDVVRLSGRPVSETVVDNANAFLGAYVVISVVSFGLLCLDVPDAVTGLSAVIACFNNIGPGMGLVGPVCNYAHLSDLSKVVLSLDMLAGRLEIFPMLMLLSRGAWRK